VLRDDFEDSHLDNLGGITFVTALAGSPKRVGVVTPTDLLLSANTALIFWRFRCIKTDDPAESYGFRLLKHFFRFGIFAVFVAAVDKGVFFVLLHGYSPFEVLLPLTLEPFIVFEAMIYSSFKKIGFQPNTELENRYSEPFLTIKKNKNNS